MLRWKFILLVSLSTAIAWAQDPATEFDDPGTESAAGTGIDSADGTGIDSAAGTGFDSAAGTGTDSADGTGLDSAAGTGIDSAAGTGVNSAAGTGINSAAGTGIDSAAGTGLNSQTYTVQDGDTLGSIAAQFYGDAGQWEKIYDANRRSLSDPNRIEGGTILTIPGD
ncbi:MAG: LysM peptidoglycan-binding domain-containing protein [Gammaproteobacteria bacterium]|nr:LysM peptidoglycan-binding domain-containing protein [Gammaproteobacteria bacterium]